ncbi:EscU/YscU/HrcU family type III secretion system export apparatus switch protein [Polaromonas sp. YR568]|jgi:flagellar biosynthesis protein|uniref:EscU/YscU/HrcU family type III secretion system export apparatus switch protein n=1 Tax=Polaromonas sp. YR568 TaxID=1855301 RepID=UPI003137ADA4
MPLLDPPPGSTAESLLSARPSAVALSAAVGNGAPRVVAKGYGATAEAIVRRAQESGLYVHTSADLVKLLMHVDLDSQIPPKLYLAVAQMLAWVHQLERQQK